jgi:hypothetical protein
MTSPPGRWERKRGNEFSKGFSPGDAGVGADFRQLLRKAESGKGRDRRPSLADGAFGFPLSFPIPSFAGENRMLLFLG